MIAERAEQTNSKTELFYEALTAYVSAKKFSSEWPVLPLRKDASIGKKFVKLRAGRFILARYDLETRQLIAL